jgi:hypothetical protein
MKDVELYSKQVKGIADKILSKTDLVNILGEFGEVIVGGSYKYDLMWGPDIDIVVKCEDPRKASKGALQKLIELRLFQKYEYGDFVKFNREDRPESYIMNLRLPYANQKWEIETWFFSKIPENQTDELIETKLNEENKITILEMKKKRDESGNTKHQLSSSEIYKRVLVDGIKNFEELI